MPAAPPDRHRGNPVDRAGEIPLNDRRRAPEGAATLRECPGCLGDRRDAVLGERADALGGGDADLGDVLDAGRDAGDLLADHVVAAGRVTLDGVAVAAGDALEAGARLADVALELVAGLGAAALVAGLELLELPLRRLARGERVRQRAGELDDA